MLSFLQVDFGEVGKAGFGFFIHWLQKAKLGLKLFVDISKCCNQSN